MPGVRLLPSVLVLLIAVSSFAEGDSRFRFDMSEESTGSLRIGGCTVESFERSAGKPAYRMKGTAGSKAGSFGFKNMPRDITPYRWLRFQMRGNPGFQESCFIAFVANRVSLNARIVGPTDKWQRVEVAIPDMRGSSKFNPQGVERLHFAFARPAGYTVEIADVELVKGAGGWRHTPKEETSRRAARRWLVEDYETAHSMPRTRPTRSKIATIYTEEPRGHAVRWKLPDSEPDACVDFKNVPKDISAYRILRFRARAPAGLAGEFKVRFRSSAGLIESRLPRFGEEWQTIEIYIPDMTMEGNFAPTAVTRIRVAGWNTKGGHIDFDDIELENQAGGWRYSAENRYEMGIDESAPFYRISNFEGMNAAGRVHTKNSSSLIMEEKKRGRVAGHFLRWTVTPGSDDPCVTFVPVPQDIRPYRTLRFRIRVDKQPMDRLKVCFQGAKGSLRQYLQLTPGRWQEMEFSLPKMRVDASFDPEQAGVFRFLYYGDRGFKLDIDDIEIVKGAGGWKLSEEDQVEFIFGKERVRKVKKTETKHFHIWTDSKAVEKKFHKSLEKMHGFVCKELSLEPPAEKLSVYIFQNSDLYFDFCERKGWTRSQAKATSGHAEGSYFATFYQAPGAATVAHELTHSIVHRTLGTGGGSWFQEGIAVFVEGRWEKRSAAGEFAARLRSDTFVPLTEFMQIAHLVREKDLTGGPGDAGWLYAQSGAFFEFLFRGPYAKSAPDRLKALSVLNPKRDPVVAEVEKILAHSIVEIEKAWVAWGGTPPKPGRK